LESKAEVFLEGTKRPAHPQHKTNFAGQIVPFCNPKEKKAL
jgi:hypothetical protein